MTTLLRTAAIVLLATSAWSQDDGNCFLSRFTESDFAPISVSIADVLHESGAIIPDRNVLTADAIDGALLAPARLGYLTYEADPNVLLLEFEAVEQATGYWIYRESGVPAAGAGLVADGLVTPPHQYIPELEVAVGVWGHIDLLPQEQMLRVAVERVSQTEGELAEASVWGVRTVQRRGNENLLSPLSWVQIASPATAVDPTTWGQLKHVR